MIDRIKNEKVGEGMIDDELRKEKNVNLKDLEIKKKESEEKKLKKKEVMWFKGI